MFLALTLSALFTSCDKPGQEATPQVTPKTDPFKNEATLNQFSTYLTASLDKTGARSQRTMSGNDFVTTVQESFKAFLKANPNLEFAQADENKIGPVIGQFGSVLIESLEKPDPENTTKEQVMEHIKAETKRFCQNIANDDKSGLTDLEKRAAVEELMVKSSILISTFNSSLGEDKLIEGGRTQGPWSWFKRKRDCIYASAKAIYHCGKIIVSAVLTGGAATLAAIVANPTIAVKCVLALYEVTQKC